MRTPQDRYFNDPVFRQLVDLFYNQMVSLNVTGTEIREAAILAEMKLRMENPGVFGNLFYNPESDYDHTR